MPILVISDIHANRTALEAVLRDAGTVDEVWCLGDLVGYGPDPNECVQIIRDVPHLTCLMGNHDAAVLGDIDIDAFNAEARQSIGWLKDRISTESLDYLRSLPASKVIGDVTLAHGSPRNPVWEYILDTRTARANFEHFSTRLCLVGHSHLPLFFHLNASSDVMTPGLAEDHRMMTLNGRSILNPGSVGQPRDRDPRAAYALFDPEASTWEIHRVEYDIPSVQERIREAGLPIRHALRLSEGW